jgi:hypothetical protein
VFELQDGITESVVGALAPSLHKAEIERARRKPPADLRAYDYLLGAVPHQMANTLEAAGEAIRLLNEALRLDPDYAYAYAYAHALLAITYGQIFRSAVGPARWELDDDGQPTQKIIETRRGAEFITPIPKPKTRKGSPAQQKMVFDEGRGLSDAKQEYDPTSIINELRQRVDWPVSEAIGRI